MKTPIFTILTAILTLTSLWAKNPVFLFDKDHQDSIELKKGAVIKDGMLILNGKRGYAEFKNSSDFRFKDTGMTIVGEVKLNEIPQTDAGISRDMIASKGYEFIFGRDGRRMYFNFKNEKRWAATFFGGSSPKKGEWVQTVCVVERINDIAQGDVGYRISFYLNGDLEARNKFMYVEPIKVKNPIQIGCGFGGGTWLLNGCISKLAIYDRPLSENEISELVEKSKFVKIVENDIVPVSKKLNDQLQTLAEKAATPQAKFLCDAVQLAILDGFDQQNVNILPAETLVSSNASFDNLFALYLKSMNKKGLNLMANPQVAVITAAMGSSGKGFPVYGLYDKKAERSVFGRKGLEWEISAETSGGKKLKFTSFNSKWQIIKANKDHIRIKWNVTDKITAYSNINLVGSRLESDFSIENNTKNILITNVLFPKVRFAKLPGKDYLTYPSMSGILVPNPTREQAITGQEGFYPSGRANMQFSSYYDEKSGIYFAFEDPGARSKYYTVSGKRNNIICTWESFVGFDKSEKKGGNSFAINGKFVIELFKGDWFDGGQIYKKFLSQKADWWIKDLPRTSTPEWYRNNSIWLLGVKCSMQPNAATTKKHVIRLRKYFEMPIAFHWYGWDDPAKGRWPHFLPKDFTAGFLAEYHKAGVYVKPYIDSRLWRVHDAPDGKSDYMYSTHGCKFAVKDSKNKPVIENYSGAFAVQCPAAKGWQDYMYNLTERLAKFGFDSIYHDQVATAKPYPCYDESHGHRLADGDVWIKHGYAPMYEKIAELKKQYPNLAHDTEEAADPYLKAMDGYIGWRWTDPGQIALYTSIYSGRIQFTGRLFNHQYPGDYESFFAKCAEQLVMSEQIGWFDYPDMLVPAKRLYVKKLAHIRNALLNYFNEADMRHPLTFATPVPVLRSKWGAVGTFSVVETPKVRHSVYERQDGTKMVIFVNSVNETISVAPQMDISGKTLCICREGSEKAELSSTVPEITLKPYTSEVWIIADAEIAGNEGSRIAKVMHKISKFTTELPQ